MKGDVETARRRTAKAFRRARHQSHVRPRKEGRDAEQRPGSPLAVHAMAKRNLGGLAPAPQDQLAAMAGGVPFHGMNPITPGRASPPPDCGGRPRATSPMTRGGAA